MNSKHKFLKWPASQFGPLIRALNLGLVSGTIEDWMYMYSKDNANWYKHVDTRKYISIKR